MGFDYGILTKTPKFSLGRKKMDKTKNRKPMITFGYL